MRRAVVPFRICVYRSIRRVLARNGQLVLLILTAGSQRQSDLRQKKNTLLERFGSVAAIRKATVEEIAATPGIGSKIASIIESHLSTIATQAINTETGEILESK